MSAGFIKLDAQKRVSLGKYTSLEPGAYFRIEQLADGVLELKPVPEEVAA